jgi:hypothetical protein
MQTSASLNDEKLHHNDLNDEWRGFEQLILKTVLDNDDSTHSSLEITGSSSLSSSQAILSQINFEVETKVLGIKVTINSNQPASSQSSWSSCFIPIQPQATSPIHNSTQIGRESSRSEENSNSSGNSDCSNQEDLSQVCPLFLKGKCRYKGRCKMSHHLDICPYCKQDMPSWKLASSTHLGRCWKKSVNSTH